MIEQSHIIDKIVNTINRNSKKTEAETILVKLVIETLSVKV